MLDESWIVVRAGAARRFVRADDVDAVRWRSRHVEIFVGDRRYRAADLSPEFVARLEGNDFVNFGSAAVRGTAIDRMESGPGREWEVHLRSGLVLRVRHSPDVDVFLERLSP